MIYVIYKYLRVHMQNTYIYTHVMQIEIYIYMSTTLYLNCVNIHMHTCPCPILLNRRSPRGVFVRKWRAGLYSQKAPGSIRLENRRLEPEKAPLKKEKDPRKSPIFGFHVSFWWSTVFWYLAISYTSIKKSQIIKT